MRDGSTDDGAGHTADDDLARAVGELGPPDHLFRVAAGWARAKLLVAAGMILFGAVGSYLWFAVGPGDFNILIKFLLMPPVLGAALLVHLVRNRGLAVLVYPTGLLRLRRGEVESFPWDEVAAVKLKVQAAAVAVSRDPDGEPAAAWVPVVVPSVQVWTARLTVERVDGASAHFGPALDGYDRLAEEVQRRTFGRFWADARGRVAAGHPVPFGDLSVYRDGLHHAGKFLRWREVKEVVVSQGRLTVKREGKWLPWAVLKDIAEVPNPHVLLALVEECRKGAVPAPVETEDGDEEAG